MIEKFKLFSSSKYLFTPVPPPDSRMVLVVTIILLIMIGLGLGCWFYLGKLNRQFPLYENLRGKLTSLLVTCGSIGLLLMFFRWQAIPYLASRVLFFILIIIFAIWALFILLYIQRTFSRELEKFRQEERYKKYLPRKKKR